MLGPFGHNWNMIVWPWNLSMIVLVFILGGRNESISLTKLSLRQQLLQKALLIPFVILPLLSFFNLWDSYLSSTMYSGTGNSATISLNPSIKQNFPAEIQRYFVPQNGKLLFDYFNWSHDELNVTFPSETRLFKDLAEYLCGYAHHASDVVVLIHGKPTLFRSDKPTTYTCATLKSDEQS
jgi:hypothetical protein